MESSLPFAVRIAAGLLSEAVGRARRLPADLTTLPVTVIGQVAKFSFELNQQLAELAAEGDRLLAGLHTDDEPPQRTAWSTIDDEDGVAAKDPQAAATWEAATPSSSGTAGAADPAAPLNPFGAPGLVLDDAPAAVPGDAAHGDPVPPASPRLVIDEDAPSPAAAAAPAGRPPSVRRPRLVPDSAAPAAPRTPKPRAGRRVGAVGDAAGARVGAPVDPTRALVGDVADLEVQRPAPLVGLPAPDEDATPDAATPDVAAMTIGQLRSRVRGWGSEQVRSALEQEQRGKARPAFLTVLTNRLSTLARGGA